MKFTGRGDQHAAGRLPNNYRERTNNSGCRVHRDRERGRPHQPEKCTTSPTLAGGAKRLEAQYPSASSVRRDGGRDQNIIRLAVIALSAPEFTTRLLDCHDPREPQQPQIGATSPFWTAAAGTKPRRPSSSAASAPAATRRRHVVRVKRRLVLQGLSVRTRFG